MVSSGRISPIRSLKSSTRPYETEMRNLLIDSFMGGAWVPLIAFNWLPSFLIIIMTSMSNISAGGPAQFVKGIIGHLLGGIVAVMLFGFSFHPHPTMPVILLSLPTLVVYPVMIAMVAHRLSQQLSRQKKELQKTLAQVKTLSGLLPICASCKKIRDDKGYWNRIETYLHDHTDADFSHGICPECAANLYPGLYNREDSTGG